MKTADQALEWTRRTSAALTRGVIGATADAGCYYLTDKSQDIVDRKMSQDIVDNGLMLRSSISHRIAWAPQNRSRL